MLVQKEQQTSAELVEVHELHNRSREEIAELQRHHQQLVDAYNAILRGKTWRLRNLIRAILGRATAPARRRRSSRSLPR
jgi:hypothetical protein